MLGLAQPEPSSARSACRHTMRLPRCWSAVDTALRLPGTAASVFSLPARWWLELGPDSRRGCPRRSDTVRRTIRTVG